MTSWQARKDRIIDANYVRALEAEVARLRLLVQELQGQQNVQETPTAVVNGPSPAETQQLTLSCASSPALDVSVQQEELDENSCLEGFRCLSIIDSNRTRFLGRSSHFPLIQAAMKMKIRRRRTSNDVEGPNEPEAHPRRPQFWFHLSDFIPPELPYTNFPDPILLQTLLDSYFSSIHVDFPLLHQPTFLQSVTSGLHLVDEGFGAVVLLVCALGSRLSHNPATLPQGAQTWQLAGWHWFDEVRARRKLMPFTSPTLYDLQVSALAAAYAATLSLPHTNYSIVGHGLRLAQDMGAHRRMTYGAVPTVEDELRKRAFWCLIAMDRSMCNILGRSYSIQPEDFDADYPIECDDGYWVTDCPQTAFRQPLGIPSSVAHFNWYLKLTDIQAHALRTIYSVRGAVDFKDPERAQRTVAELDSRLNNWAGSLPQELRYDPHREDTPFAAQAASLHAAYHMLRIFIHRPFITTPRADCLPFPSFTICTNAARACIQTLDRYFFLAGPVMVYQFHLGSLFAAALVLLLHVWRGVAIDVEGELEHVRQALRVFKSLEVYRDAAGRLWDMLHDLLDTVEAQLKGEGSVAANSEADIPSTPGKPSAYFESTASTSFSGVDQARDFGPALSLTTLLPSDTTSSVPPSDNEFELFADLFPALLQGSQLGASSTSHWDLRGAALISGDDAMSAGTSGPPLSYAYPAGHWHIPQTQWSPDTASF